MSVKRSRPFFFFGRLKILTVVTKYLYMVSGSNNPLYLNFTCLGTSVDNFKQDLPISPKNGTYLYNNSQSQVYGKRVNVNEKEVALFSYQDNFYALDEKCPHLGMFDTSIKSSRSEPFYNPQVVHYILEILKIWVHIVARVWCVHGTSGALSCLQESKCGPLDVTTT